MSTVSEATEVIASIIGDDPLAGVAADMLEERGLLYSELPEPSKTGNTYSTWFTGHAVAIEGVIDDSGVVTHLHSRGAIYVATHEGNVLSLDYDEARRVALALLAAVEEAETMKEGTL
ncbi:hypothetical protein HMPREF3166_01480 [Corynebacterium sp. HMSC08A12]|uniref:hypothetical protein n=1 Tax=Corynebacterium sp. HMSC08A12 TaxID=1581134 RepID=UPI0008A32AA7|nr:hypothetical protein [Corynebacterium sp. HMSC08A12]OFT36220.1 hypothetical protein HMPREF3166_01480 [Corynebacterium sp. HMSC08A12]